MKADALPTAIPEWVPASVARINRNSRHGLPLLQDPRMRNVWGPLSRRRNGGFLYPASMSTPGESAEERQDNAMAALFRYTLFAMMLPKTVVTRRQAELKRDRLLAKARELQADAEAWLIDAPTSGPFELFSDEDAPNPCWQRLMAASKAYEEMARKIYEADTQLPLERDRGGDGDVRWFALAIANQCQLLFGSPMYGISATITSVALGREVTARTVRDWLDPCG
jgi:hypothetical protein